MPEKLRLIGALAGDIIGSVYERSGLKNYDFPLFHPRSRPTDDSVLTLAVAAAVLYDHDYKEAILEFALAYPRSGFGSFFRKWMYSQNPEPYNSFGNGSAMRVSAIGWGFNSVEKVLEQAEKSASVTHNHPEGIKGAKAAALCVYLARKQASKEEIRREITERFSYDLSRTLDEIRPSYSFDVSCQGTVPQAILAFLESKDFEDAVRLAVSLGGDADTLGAITGSIAEAWYGGVPQGILLEVQERMPDPLWKVVELFSEKYK